MNAKHNLSELEAIATRLRLHVVNIVAPWDGPAYLRMKRPETTPPDFEPLSLQVGKGVIRRDGNDVTIISAGLCVKESLSAAEALVNEGIEARIVDMASLKPIDEALILECASKTGAIVTAENHSIIGGLGSAVAEVLMDEGIGLPFKRVGVQDRFCEGGTTPYLMNKFGLDAPAIAQAVRGVMQRKKG